MEFRDYAAKETTALFTKLLASQAETSAQHLQTLRAALDGVYRAIEASAAATPQADEEVQELIRRLNTAAGAAARAASQRVQKEAQTTIDAVNADLGAARAEGDRLKSAVDEAHAQAEAVRAELRKETERADAADRDLDAAIEAHGHVDAQRLEAESTCRQLTNAKAALEKELDESRSLLDATVSDAARLERELETARGEAAKLNETLSHERSASERAQHEAQSALDAVNNDLRAEREQGDRLSASLAEVESQVEALRGELGEAQSQAEVLRSELHKQTERAEASDRDLDAAIEAHAVVDGQRLEAEAMARQHAQAKASAEKDLGELRGLLDASVAQANRLTMQLDATLAENRTLAADVSAAQGELDAARTQREAITAQLDASRARIQTLERNQQAHDDHVRQLESGLQDALQAEANARQQAATTDVDNALAEADMSALRLDISRLGSLLDASARAVDELAAASSLTDLLAALVQQLAGEFSRVALFRVKANRLQGEHQVGFDLTTDVTKLVIPLSVDSLLTRAVTSGFSEHVTGTELDENSRAPFGGTPTMAIALPIAFQGETLALVYADSDRPESERGPAGHEASAGFATLLVRTTTVLLMRLSQELKTLNELREYASMLLQEAQEMYAADMEADRGDDERRSRLKDTIECARQLYAQRASMEGPAAAMLLDERIAGAIESEASTPFGQDLAAIAGNTLRHNESRHTAAS
jgi:DNA repair exonuclease SbcCD ATPase subunit